MSGIFSKYILLIFCAAVSIIISAHAQNGNQIKPNFTGELGQLYATTWAGDKQSAFSFSFDDGFISQYNHVNNILTEHNFNATFYVPPPFLTDSLPGIWRYGTWPMFETILSEGNEIGSHTLNHPFLAQLPVGDTLTESTIVYELYHSKRMIEERIFGYNCITLAYPFGEHNDVIDSLANLFYESARAIGKNPNESKISGMDFFKLNSRQVEFDDPRNSFEDDLDELNDFISWIENSISTGSWGIQLAHEVVPFAELNELISQGAYFPISNEWLDLLFTWLEIKLYENKIWIETIANITKYIRERDSYDYQIILANNSSIEIELTDTLSDEIYNYPITAYIVVPAKWEYALIEQSDRSEVLQTFVNDSLNYILAEVVPDYGTIKITEFEPSNIITENQNSPSGYELYQNFPNPFNPGTTIKFTISNNVIASGSKQSAFTTLKVYDVLGNEVATLVNEELQQGTYTIEFNVNSLSGESWNLSSGVYFYKLYSGNYIDTKKMLLLK